MSSTSKPETPTVGHGQSETDAEKKKTFLIRIDRTRYHVSEKHLTGNQLRQLAGLGDDVDLYLEVDSAEDDQLIDDDEKVKMKDGLDFFSTPRNITPGHE